MAYEVIRRDGDCVQTSISAYYYTHAQAIFVGALIRNRGMSDLPAQDVLRVVFLEHREWFVDHGHNWAAFPMFGSIIVVVANRYLLIAIVMPVSVLGLLLLGGKYHVLEAEIAAIVLFAVFWAIQTEELWDEGLRPGGRTV